MPNPLDIKVGDVYSRLTVIEKPFSQRNPKGRMERFVNCKCICGTVKVVSLNKLRMKKTLSCGCYNKEQISKKKLSDEIGLKTLYSENISFQLNKGTWISSLVRKHCFQKFVRIVPIAETLLANLTENVSLFCTMVLIELITTSDTLNLTYHLVVSSVIK